MKVLRKPSTNRSEKKRVQFQTRKILLKFCFECKRAALLPKSSRGPIESYQGQAARLRVSLSLFILAMPEGVSTPPSEAVWRVRFSSEGDADAFFCEARRGEALFALANDRRAPLEMEGLLRALPFLKRILRSGGVVVLGAADSRHGKI